MQLIKNLMPDDERIGHDHHGLCGDPRLLSTGYAWRDVAPILADAGLAVLIPDMRGYGDSDKPKGNEGYDARALAEEARALISKLGFGKGKPLIHAAHDMGALPALIWCADHVQEVRALLYIEAPVMLGVVLRKIIAYTPEAMAKGSMWWWILPLAPGVPERLVVCNERAFLTWNLSHRLHQHRANRAPHEGQGDRARRGDGRRKGRPGRQGRRHGEADRRACRCGEPAGWRPFPAGGMSG